HRVVQWCVDLRHLPSFPTRRSSDLVGALARLKGNDFGTHPINAPSRPHPACATSARNSASAAPRSNGCTCPRSASARSARSRARSEEHTSELQSRENLVCRLLLEKK